MEAGMKQLVAALAAAVVLTLAVVAPAAAARSHAPAVPGGPAKATTLRVSAVANPTP
jgi:hypothetical protein